MNERKNVLVQIFKLMETCSESFKENQTESTFCINMEKYRKYILDRFQEHLHQNFKSHCERHGIDQTDDHLLTFLIDQNLLPITQIQRYTVLKEFENLYPERYPHKTQTVNALADRFCISERTIWSILKHLNKF